MERLSANKLGGTGEVYDPHAPITHTKSPIVQGTSVLGIKYKVSQRLTITYFFFSPFPFPLSPFIQVLLFVFLIFFLFCVGSAETLTILFIFISICFSCLSLCVLHRMVSCLLQILLVPMEVLHVSKTFVAFALWVNTHYWVLVVNTVITNTSCSSWSAQQLMTFVLMMGARWIHLMFTLC